MCVHTDKQQTSIVRVNKLINTHTPHRERKISNVTNQERDKNQLSRFSLHCGLRVKTQDHA